jgi:hypothetical protein
MTIEWVTPTIIAVAVSAVFALLRSRARKAQPVQSGVEKVFRPVYGAKLLLLMGIVLGIAGIAATLAWKMQWWVSCLFGAFVLLSALGWPSTITLSERGLRRESWWRQPVDILWTDISEIQRSKSGPGTAYVVVDRQGSKIEVSVFHSAFEQIGSEISRRTGRECPTLTAPFG